MRFSTYEVENPNKAEDFGLEIWLLWTVVCKGLLIVVGRLEKKFFYPLNSITCPLFSLLLI